MWKVHWYDGLWKGCYETGEDYAEPEANILSFLCVIESLEEPALSEWHACTRRAFDIGYSAGYEPFDFSQAVSSDTLGRIAKVGASLRITIYAPDKKADPTAAPPG